MSKNRTDSSKCFPLPIVTCSAYRLRILKEVDACKRPGEVGALQAMRGRRRGPTPRPVDLRVKQLEAENRRLQRKLQRAETIITLQKNKLPRSWGSP